MEHLPRLLRHCLCIFVLLALIFVPMGQVVSGEIDRAPTSLRGYSWNLSGSLLGVVAFLAMSRWMLPPWVWMATVLAGFALLQTRPRDLIFVASLLLPLSLLLIDPAEQNTQIVWTPYQQIQYTRRFTAAGDIWGGLLLVNKVPYQMIVNLSQEFLARHPILSGESDYNPYNLPSRFAVQSPSVLVVGSGTGNDVAAALRHNSHSIDAVEIDPAILQLGRKEHPEHPYESPRVTVHLGDARNFLKRTDSHYDLILFGLLDSHSQFSDYSNMRIDNFVYTEEAFQEATRHLTPDGIIFVKFQVDRPWIATRISKMLQQALGTAPLIFQANSSYSAPATCFVGYRSGRVDKVLAADAALRNFTRENHVQLDPEDVPITTDDWPYIYQKNHRIPHVYYSVSILVILVALFFYFTAGGVVARPTPSSVFFFGMGAGFLLLETQVISRLALFYGTIWQVNGIVISAVLIALLLANVVVERMRPLPRFWILAALMAGLAFAYWFPFDKISAQPAISGIVAITIFCLPIWFAGILFSSEFKRVASPSAALKANVLGAVAGGLLESLSLVFGLRALFLVAIALYFLAGTGLWLNKSQNGFTTRDPNAAVR
jgi:spermidine synthase